MLLPAYLAQQCAIHSITPADLTPSAIIERLHLHAPIYASTARYGHFGVKPKTEEGKVFHAWEE